MVACRGKAVDRFSLCADNFDIVSRLSDSLVNDSLVPGGGGGDSHMEQTWMLVGNFELNPLR